MRWSPSANDASHGAGELLGGSEQGFARMMTAKARSLGMKGTVFRNPHGLPDPGQFTTARDMATLGIALREHFPQYYDYFSVRSFKYGRSASPTTTGCWAGSRASTASRPATPAPRASTWSRR
jgi:D-alanyl-D-alanine carboxypeptidase